MKEQFIQLLVTFVLSTSSLFTTAVFADVVENFKKFEETGRQLQESQSERITELESKFLEICEKYAEIDALDEMDPDEFLKNVMN